MGANPVEEAQVDMWCVLCPGFFFLAFFCAANSRSRASSRIEHLRDIQDAFGKAKALPEDPACPGVTPLAKFVAEELPILLTKLSAVAAITGTPGYAVGNKLSLAGLRLYLMATDGMVPSGGVAEIAAAFKAQPALQAIIDNVAANAHLQKWLAARPVTPF